MHIYVYMVLFVLYPSIRFHQEHPSGQGIGTRMPGFHLSVDVLGGWLWRRSVGRSGSRTVGRSDSWTVRRSAGRTVGQSVGPSDGRSVGRSVGRSPGRSVKGNAAVELIDASSSLPWCMVLVGENRHHHSSSYIYIHIYIYISKLFY